MILLSTDDTRQLYDSRANRLFAEYGGGHWPSILLPNGFEDTIFLGDFGYGCLIIDATGIVRSVNDYDLEQAVDAVFEQSNQPGVD